MTKKIILDQSTFKALAAETRVRILKLLKKRQYMQSELAEALHLAVPTIKEHLNSMEKAGLVLRLEEGRKWKYYKLALKGKALLEPEEEMHQLWVVLGLFGMAVIGGIVGLVKSILAPYYAGEVYAAQRAAPLAAPESIAADTLAESAAIGAPSLWSNPWLWLYVGILAVLVGLVVYKYFKYQKAKKERDAIFQ